MDVAIEVDAELLKDAREFTGILDDAAVVHEGLRLLVQREVAKRLIAFGGSDPDAVAGPRRKVPALDYC